MDLYKDTTVVSTPPPYGGGGKGGEASPLIEIRNLSAGYEGKTVLHDVNLTIYERDFLGVIGRNGGGKTTLVKCILGLLKPMAGEIIYNVGTHPGASYAEPLKNRSYLPHLRTHQGASLQSTSIGYLPQYTNLDRRFPITVEEIVLSGLSSKQTLTARYTPEQREKARQVIAQMGLKGLERQAIGELSGGQMQRTLLGRAIISDPQLVILDEPATYIDKHFEARLYELLAEINRRCAIVLVSHDIGTVLQEVKSIACVNETLDYHPDTTITEEQLEQTFECPIEILVHGTVPHRVLGHHHHHS